MAAWPKLPRLSSTLQYFENALAELKKRQSEIDTDLVAASATEFSAEIFVRGKSKCKCRIWLGGMFGSNEIAYAEGTSISGNAMNDSLSLTADRGELAFRTLMGGAFGRIPDGLDVQHLSPEQAAEYLWRRFVAPLEH